MTTYNSSSIVAASTNSAARTYNLNIADKTGHTVVENLDLEQTVDNLLEQAESQARWIYINGAKFEFESGAVNTTQNRQKLSTALESVDDTTVMLTGRLIGGAK